MAIGDSIDDHIAASTDLQPSAGVEDAVTLVAGTNTNLSQWKDGSVTVNVQEHSTGVTSGKRLLTYITNTNYFGTIASGPCRIGGVQTNA
jgi:hypothetical protein